MPAHLQLQLLHPLLLLVLEVLLHSQSRMCLQL
jgi:hypothetical protein